MQDDSRSCRADGATTTRQSAVCTAMLIMTTIMILADQSVIRYGVSRVYSQQCGYVLADTQNFRDKMRGVVVVMKEMEIDPEAGMARLDIETPVDCFKFLN